MCVFIEFRLSEVYCRLILFKTWIRSRNYVLSQFTSVEDLSETEKNFQLVLKNRRKNRRKSRKKKSGCKSHLYYMGTTLKCKYEFFACIET